MMQVEGFPCQMLDFAELTYTIDEIGRWEEQYCFNEVLEMNVPKEETFDCLVEGMCYQDARLVNVFFVMTTKQIIIYIIVTEKTVKVIKSIDVSQLEMIFLYKRELSLIRKVGDSKVVEKFDIKIGCDEEMFNEQSHNLTTQRNTTKNEKTMNTTGLHRNNNTTMLTNNNTAVGIMEAEEDRQKQKNKHLRETNYQVKAFYFCVSLWRIYFILTNKFLSIFKLTDKSYLDYIMWEEGYLENIYKKIIDKRCTIIFDCYIKYEEKKFLMQREKLRKNGGMREEDAQTDQEAAADLVETKKETSGKITNKLDGVVNALYDDPGKSLEFTHQSYKYSKFIVKIFQEHLVFFDIYNDTISFIDLKLVDAIFTNENRFLLVMYIYPNHEFKQLERKGDREKIVLYHNTSYDAEYNFFRIFLIHLFEFKRLCKYDYEIDILPAEKIWAKIKIDKLMYYSYTKNNFYVKVKEKKSGLGGNSVYLAKYTNIKKGEKTCCWKKKDNFKSTKLNSKEKFNFMKNIKGEGENMEKGCSIL